MKLAFVFLLLSTSAFAEWKVIAKTMSCRSVVTIEAKEGENFVYANQEGKRRKLLEQNKRIYSKLRKDTLTYQSDTVNDNYQLGDATFTFVLPGTVMSHMPSITVFLSGVSYKCQMAYKD